MLSLDTVFLCDSKVGWEGASVIGDALGKLLEVYLAYNPIKRALSSICRLPSVTVLDSSSMMMQFEIHTRQTGL